MGSFIESLESRTLLSAVGILVSESKVVDADGVTLGKLGVANYKTIYADLKAAGETKSSKGGLKSLLIEGVATFKAAKLDVIRTDALIKADLKKLEVAFAHLEKKPTNLTLQAKVTAAGDTLTQDAANRLTVVTNDLNAQKSTNEANVAALETANPSNTQLSSDVTNVIGPETDAARNALITALTTALTTDVTAVVAAYPA